MPPSSSARIWIARQHETLNDVEFDALRRFWACWNRTSDDVKSDEN